MEREEGGRAEPVRGRDKILCYINMQSPGRSSDLNPERLKGTKTWWRSNWIRMVVVCVLSLFNARDDFNSVVCFLYLRYFSF